MRKILSIFIMILLVGCFGNPGKDYVPKDIKNEFCGHKIDYQFCKCAFHGEFCSDPIVKAKGITSRSEAKAYVEAEYAKAEKKLEEQFKKECESKPKNHYFADGQRCEWCNPCYKFDEEYECVESE